MKATLSTEIKQLKLQKPQCGTPQMPWKSSDNSQVKRCQNRSCSSSGLEGLMYPTEYMGDPGRASQPNCTPEPLGPSFPLLLLGISSSNSLLAWLDATLSLPPGIC